MEIGFGVSVKIDPKGLKQLKKKQLLSLEKTFGQALEEIQKIKVEKKWDGDQGKGKGKGGKGKGGQKAEAKSGGIHPKLQKAALKEGGKKGQDVAGMAAFGCHWFFVQVDSPKGDMDVLKLVMQGMNKPCPPDAEERRGGAGEYGKCLMSFSDKQLAILIHVPKELDEKTDNFPAKEWFELVCKVAQATPVDVPAGMLGAIVKGDPDKNVYPEKLKDQAIGQGYAVLTQKGLVPEDDSDSDCCFGDDDLLAGSDKSDSDSD